MRSLLTLFLLAGAIRLPVHRDIAKLPPAVRAALPGDFNPSREALAGTLPDAGPVTLLAPSPPLPTDGGSGTITVVEQVATCHGKVAGAAAPSLSGVLYRVPRNIRSVHLRVRRTKVEVCAVKPEPGRDPHCVCQGIALSREQRARGIHLCAQCQAP